jgi:hypothetical protein
MHNHAHDTNWHQDRSTLTIMSGLHTALAAAFVIVSAWVLSRSFDHCNVYLNGLFIIFLIYNICDLGMGVFRLVVPSIPAPSSHMTASAWNGMKMVFYIFFVVVAFMQDHNAGYTCDPTVVKASRALAPMSLFFVMMQQGIVEYGFSVPHHNH